MSIVIVRYNAGNILSVRLALQRLGYTSLVSDDPAVIEGADKVIFPGQGEASSAMRYLKQHGLTTVLTALRQPLLGICLGLQLMAVSSEENNTDGLCIIPGRIRRFPSTGKVPHMGWNKIYNLKGPLFRCVTEGSYVYFVHSYYMELNAHTTAVTDYQLPFSSAAEKDNYFAVQFHPEKSAGIGEQILKNFLEL